MRQNRVVGKPEDKEMKTVKEKRSRYMYGYTVRINLTRENKIKV